MQRIRSLLPGIGATLLCALPGTAQAMVEVQRGPASELFGSCMPTLLATNKSARPVDYLQIDLVVKLRGGREARIELKSAYRYGIVKPIAPGAAAVLKINGDESVPLGARCGDIDGVRAIVAVCEAAGQDCSASVTLDLLKP